MTVSLEVLDAHNGLPVAQLPVRFERRESEGWTVVACERTDESGRVEKWSDDGGGGYAYRCVLDTDRYFTSLGLSSFYAEIILALRPGAPDRGLRITVLVSAHAYLLQNEYG